MEPEGEKIEGSEHMWMAVRWGGGARGFILPSHLFVYMFGEFHIESRQKAIKPTDRLPSFMTVVEEVCVPGWGGGRRCVCSHAFFSLSTLGWLHPMGDDFWIDIKRSNRLKGYQVSTHRQTSLFRGPQGPAPLGYCHGQRPNKTAG